MKTGPEPYEPFLKGLVQRGITPVLVAGQAVNYWAERYAERNEKLREKAPFTSGDMEIYRTSIPREYAKSLPAGELYENDPFAKALPADSATCYFDWDGNSMVVQVMRHLEGLSEAEVEKRSVPAKIGNVPIKVLDPLALCQAKTANLLKIKQAGRQDLRHLEISILCSGEFISDVLDKDGPRAALNLVKRMKEIALSKGATEVRKTDLVDWSPAIPWSAIEARRETETLIARFLDSDAPRWRKLLAPPLPMGSNPPGATSGGNLPEI
jgi:hypothetical protein